MNNEAGNLVLLVTLIASACVGGPPSHGPRPPGVSRQPAKPLPGLECRLETAATFRPGQAVEVLFTLSNNSNGPLYVLPWYTPLEGLWGEIFAVERNGAPVRYDGPLATRTNPTAQDYVLVAAGAQVSARVDLATTYDLRPPGTYQVRFVAGLADVSADRTALPRPMDAHRPARLSCNTMSFQVIEG